MGVWEVKICKEPDLCDVSLAENYILFVDE